jgi:hypothetical protein
MSEPVSAEVKAILISGEGAARDLAVDGFSPPDPDHFGAHVQVLIGSPDSEASDSFDVYLCTPSWAAVELSGPWDRFGSLRSMPDTVLPGRSLWFMRRWDRAEFVSAVEAVCRAFSPGPDWGTVADRIGRVIPWEFDYKYDAHMDRSSGQPFPP